MIKQPEDLSSLTLTQLNVARETTFSVTQSSEHASGGISDSLSRTFSGQPAPHRPEQQDYGRTFAKSESCGSYGRRLGHSMARNEGNSPPPTQRKMTSPSIVEESETMLSISKDLAKINEDTDFNSYRSVSLIRKEDSVGNSSASIGIPTMLHIRPSGTADDPNPHNNPQKINASYLSDDSHCSVSSLDSNDYDNSDVSDPPNQPPILPDHAHTSIKRSPQSHHKLTSPVTTPSNTVLKRQSFSTSQVVFPQTERYTLPDTPAHPLSTLTTPPSTTYASFISNSHVSSSRRPPLPLSQQPHAPTPPNHHSHLKSSSSTSSTIKRSTQSLDSLMAHYSLQHTSPSVDDSSRGRTATTSASGHKGSHQPSAGQAREAGGAKVAQQSPHVFTSVAEGSTSTFAAWRGIPSDASLPQLIARDISQGGPLAQLDTMHVHGTLPLQTSQSSDSGRQAMSLKRGNTGGLLKSRRKSSVGDGGALGEGPSTSHKPHTGKRIIKSMKNYCKLPKREDPMRCARCKKKLGNGPVVVAENSVHRWHEHCLCCNHCGQKFETQTSNPNRACVTSQIDGRLYHAECHSARFHPVCYICNEYVPSYQGVAQYHADSFWQQPYCSRHNEEKPLTPQCCACRRLQGYNQTYRTLPDGRFQCSECLASAVSDRMAAESLYDVVRAFYASKGMAARVRPPLRLVDAHQFRQYTSCARGHSHTRGLTLTEEYSRVSRYGHREPAAPERTQVNAILILSDLPRLLTGCVLAHELMHVWLRTREITSLQVRVEEGLCQLMAFLWLREQANNTKGRKQDQLALYFQHEIMHEVSPEYGDGFRDAYKAFKVHGLRAVIDTVVATKQLPM